nr:retrovirus-related Pol polyprotein from transposon TNT 1-94 [Tanacetum cinerariifolium]
GFQVSNDDAAVGQRQLEDTQLEEKTNIDSLEKEQEKIEDEDQTLMLLTSLPPSYENFMKTLLYERESLTMDDAMATLNSKELKKITEGTQEETSDGLSIKERFDHSEGHLKRDYLMNNSSGFVNKAKRGQDSDSSNNEGNSYFVESLVVVKNDEMTKLVIDSCRSYHMPHMRDFVYDFKSFDGGSIQLGAQEDRKAKGFQVSNDDAAVAHRPLEDKQLEEKINMDCFVKEQKKSIVFSTCARYNSQSSVPRLNFGFVVVIIQQES